MQQSEHNDDEQGLMFKDLFVGKLSAANIPLLQTALKNSWHRKTNVFKNYVLMIPLDNKTILPLPRLGNINNIYKS